MAVLSLSDYICCKEKMGTHNYRIGGRIFISILLLFFLYHKVEWPQIWEALRETDLQYYTLSTSLLFLLVWLNSVKFSLFLKNTKIQQPVSFLVKVNITSRFYSMFLPGSLGNMAVRWFKITENKHARGFFLAVSIFERLLHICLLLIFGTVPLFVFSNLAEAAYLRPIVLPIAMILLILAVLGMLFFLSPALPAFIQKVVKSSNQTGRWHSTVSSFIDKLPIPLLSASVFAKVTAIDIFWVVIFTCRVFILARAGDISLAYIDMVWMSCLVLFLRNIPISQAGIGVREGAYAYLFSVVGLPPEKGVLLGILILSQMVLLSTIGGILELTDK